VRAALGALGGALIAAGGCAGGPDATSGSTLEGARTWEAARGLDGEALEEWVRPEGPLPPDTISVTLFASGDGDEAISFGVRDVDDRVLVDARAPEQSPNRLLRGRGAVVGMIPSGSVALPLAANFHVRASRLLANPAASDERPVVVSAWVKRSGAGAAVPERQELPLALFLVGPRRYDPARIAVALGEAGRIWRAAGVELREPARIAIDGAEGLGFERVRVEPELGPDSPALRALFHLSERAPEGTLALFLVPDLATGGPGYPVWALSGSIPVPPRLGTVRSGLAVNGSLLDLDPVWTGQIMAHEIGHALGLYHTTERDLANAGTRAAPVRQAIHDPIDDTPECPAQADSSPIDGALSADECAAHDTGNLMFWAATRGATTLTRGQADMARRSALVR
jgi:hypothetical protein